MDSLDSRKIRASARIGSRESSEGWISVRVTGVPSSQLAKSVNLGIMDKVAESFHMATRFALAMAQIGQPMAQTGALSLQNSCYILSKNLEMSLAEKCSARNRQMSSYMEIAKLYDLRSLFDFGSV